MTYKGSCTHCNTEYTRVQERYVEQLTDSCTCGAKVILQVEKLTVEEVFNRLDTISYEESRLLKIIDTTKDLEYRKIITNEIKLLRKERLGLEIYENY